MIYSEDAVSGNPLLKKNSVVIGLSAVIQCVTLAAPSALVWYPEFAGIGNRGNSSSSNYGGGSPLDICPVAPSQLPLQALVFEPNSCGTDNEQIIRDQLAESEQCIIQRSNAVEQHWSCDRWRADPVIVETLSKVINYLNHVDYQCQKTTPIQAGGVFGKWNDTYKSPPNHTNCIVEELYNQIFENTVCSSDQNQRSLAIQDAIVGALCQWAISTERRGQWRATLVAKILERRQDFLSAEKEDANGGEEPSYTTQQSFHNSVLKFLDQGPVLSDCENLEELISFQLLMQLMGELIRHDVFNYSNYLNFMICTSEFHRLQLRCDVPDFPNENSTPIVEGVVYDSPKETEFLWGYDQPRHVQYIFHMPVSSSTTFEWMDYEKGETSTPAGTTDDSQNAATNGQSHLSGQTTPTETPSDYFEAAFLQNERNQRLVMLYGTGKNKATVQNAHNRLTKHLTKALFRMNLQKTKTSTALETNENGSSSVSPGTPENAMNIERNRLEYSIRQLYSRSMFERNAICCQVAKYILIACEKYIKGDSNQLPSVSGIVRLMSLLDNVCFAPHVLVAFTARLAQLAKPIEHTIRSKTKNKKSPEKTTMSMALQQSGFFTRTLGLNCAAVARQHHTLFVIEAPDSLALQRWFDGFWALVRNSRPSECSSAERNIFYVLYEQWITCQAIITKFFKQQYGSDASQIEWITYVMGWPENVANAMTEPPKNGPKAIKRSVHLVVQDAQDEVENIGGKHNPSMFAEIIENPFPYPNNNSGKTKISKLAKDHFQDDTAEATSNRYSFICNVIIKICSGTLSLDHISHLAALAAEMASYAPKFTKAWMAAIITIIRSTERSVNPSTAGGWQDCLLNINLSDCSIYEPLATLITSLIARGVIDIDQLNQNCIAAVIQLIFPQQNARRGDLENDQRLLNGPKFTLYLLLRVFADSNPLSSSYYSWASKNFKSPYDGASIKGKRTAGTCGITIQADRRLLAAHQNSLNVVFLFAITKSLIILADRIAPENIEQQVSNRGSRRQQQIIPSLQFLLTISPVCQYSTNSCGLKTEGLQTMFKSVRNFGVLARRTLKLITAQQCVKECFLSASFDQFLNSSGLADEHLQSYQKQLLLQHFLYPRRQVRELVPDPFINELPTEESGVNNNHISLSQLEYLKLIVSNTTIWNMRQTVLELKVLHKLIDNGMQDDISTALTSIFNESSPTSSSDLQMVGLKIHCAWLVGYVIQKLDPSVQKSVLKKCQTILQREQRASQYMEADDSGQQVLYAPQPFLNLILNSLEGQTQSSVELVESLRENIDKILRGLIGPNTNSSSRQSQNLPVVTEAKQIETRNKIRDRLPLRLSLIGGMIDAVIKSPQLMQDITKLLISLIASGLVAVDTGDTSDDDLFYTTFDMLAVILWNCLGGDAPELYTQFIKQKEYQILMKHMKKEVQDRMTNSIALLKMLSPLPRVYTTIVTYEPKSIVYDKDQKIAKVNPNILSTAKNQNRSSKKNSKSQCGGYNEEFSLQFSGVKVLNPWEIIEAVKPMANLNPAWFGARRIEKEPEFWENEQRLIKTYYLHNGKRSREYYMDTPDIEELAKEESSSSTQEKVQIKEEVKVAPKPQPKPVSQPPPQQQQQQHQQQTQQHQNTQQQQPPQYQHQTQMGYNQPNYPPQQPQQGYQQQSQYQIQQQRIMMQQQHQQRMQQQHQQQMQHQAQNQMSATSALNNYARQRSYNNYNNQPRGATPGPSNNAGFQRGGKPQPPQQQSGPQGYQQNQGQQQQGGQQGGPSGSQQPHPGQPHAGQNQPQYQGQNYGYRPGYNPQQAAAAQQQAQAQAQYRQPGPGQHHYQQQQQGYYPNQQYPGYR